MHGVGNAYPLVGRESSNGTKELSNIHVPLKLLEEVLNLTPRFGIGSKYTELRVRSK